MIGERDFLASYDAGAFAPVAVTTDIVLLTIRDGALCVLLVRRGDHPFRGRWALPGGFVRPDEDLERAARRELAEETGVAQPPGHLEQLRTYGHPRRDPRMRVVSVAYVGLVPDQPAPAPSTDAADARWWAVGDIEGPRPPRLAFDHATIVADGIERARAKLEYTTLATSFVAEPFTLAELRQVYECVWAVPIHGPNFRRKVLATPGFVAPVEAKRGGVGRPAELFRRGGATVLRRPILRAPQ